jgi:hypothetical protein
MAKRKNPAAVALGRRGGKVSGIKKGFAALTAEKLAELQARALAKRQETAGESQRQAASLKVHGDPLDPPRRAPAKKKGK